MDETTFQLSYTHRRSSLGFAFLRSSLQVYYWKQHKHNQHHMEKHILDFSGNHSRGMLPGLQPFSLYSFNVRVYNGKGEGPPSPTQQFETPEGGEEEAEGPSSERSGQVMTKCKKRGRVPCRRP